MSEEVAAVPSVPVDYDIPTGAYASFIDDLRAELANHPDPDSVEGHPVLAKQLFPQEPARWMYCNIKAAAGEHKDEAAEATLAVRDDNVYLIGFKAQSGKWYEFGFEGKTVRMLPDSTFLQCDVDYRSLVGGATSKEVRANLVKMQLGKSFAEEGVSRLSGYGVQAAGGGAAPDDATKLALARLIVMVCESARMISISDTVSNGWAGESSISSQQVDYLWNWALMSQALLGWRAYGDKYIWPKRLTKIGIRNKDDALSVVQLLLNKPAPTPELLVDAHTEEEDEALGQALVEVFSVRADFPVIGTIAVFDGMRGQIIYHGNNDDDRSPGTKQVDELVLTGPYRAISAAHGNCTIQVIGSAGGTLRCWDCYADQRHSDAAYDAPLTRAISTARGPVEVTHAVLSNAVEATIQVKLLANAGTGTGTHVYGKVTARSGAFHGVGSVIFSSDSDDQVAVAMDDCTVPLARNVVAAPLGSPLVVEVTLHTSQNNDDDVVVVVQCKLEFDPDLSGEHVKLVPGEQGHGAVEVKVTWSDI